MCSGEEPDEKTMVGMTLLWNSFIVHSFYDIRSVWYSFTLFHVDDSIYPKYVLFHQFPHQTFIILSHYMMRKTGPNNQPSTTVLDSWYEVFEVLFCFLQTCCCAWWPNISVSSVSMKVVQRSCGLFRCHKRLNECNGSCSWTLPKPGIEPGTFRSSV